MAYTIRQYQTFQSTLSVRRATTAPTALSTTYTFQSTLSVRRATYVTRGHIGVANISIHALRKEINRGLPRPGR